MPEARSSITELERLLSRQKKRLQQLQKTRKRLVAEIARIDGKISSLLGKPAVAKTVRHLIKKRGKGLQKHVLNALKENPEPMTAAEIAQAITQAGYRSFSKNLVSLVRQTCYRSKGVETRERGKFVLSGQNRPLSSRRKQKTAARKRASGG